MANYRKIWEAAYGPIPKDDQGRSYDIHHIDGNNKNNDLSNLKAVSIQEHWAIHYDQGDYMAANYIAFRLEKEYVGGYKLSEKTKTKISEANKGKKLSEEHKAKFCAKGKKHSEEAKAKMSSAKKGAIFSEEHKIKLREAKKGKKHSEETKAKMSVSRLGRSQSEEHIAKRVAANKGRKLSDTARANMSAAQKGKNRSEETKAKMSESRKNWHARNRLKANEL